MFRLSIFSFLAFAILSFYPNHPVYAASGVGRVVYTSGPAWLERGSSREEVKKGAVVLQNDTIITGPRGRAKVIMGDGSKIYIGTNSRISLRKYIVDNDKLKDATVSMLWGKARFFVNKLTSKESSFRVRTSTAVLGVRGTEFIVSVPPTPALLARAFEKFTLSDIPPLPMRTVLFEGAVDIDTGLGLAQRLTPGNTADVDTNRGIKIQKTKSSDIDGHKDQSFKSSNKKDEDTKNEQKEPEEGLGNSKEQEQKSNEKGGESKEKTKPGEKVLNEPEGASTGPDSFTDPEVDNFQPSTTLQRQVKVPSLDIKPPKVDVTPTTNAIQNLGTTTDVNIKAGFVKP